MRIHGADADGRPFRILSLDGGGIRGAFIAGFLAGVEERIGHSIGRYFDLIAGTSTGGIIAAALAFGEPATRIESFYRDHGPKIFLRPWEKPIAPWKQPFRWASRLYPSVVDRAIYNRFSIDHNWLRNSKYGADELKTALEEVFGNKKFGQASTRLVIPAVNAISGQPKVFKTSHLPHLFTDHNYKVVDVLLATAAAPTYFPHAVVEPGSAYVDGGLWANNPSMVSLVEAMMISDRCRREGIDPSFSIDATYMMSIGTGKSPISTNPPGDKAGIFWWMSNKLLDLISLSQSKGIDFQTQFILEKRIKRIEFDLPGSEWTLDNASLVNSMLHLGRQRAIADVEEYREEFFWQAVVPFTPYEATAAPEIAASVPPPPIGHKQVAEDQQLLS
jgi:uncharacterized protein